MSDLVPQSRFEVERPAGPSGYNGSGSAPSTMTTRDYIKVLFRQRSIILLTVLTVTLATFAGLQLKTPVYEAQVKMLITAEKQTDSPYYRDILAGRNVEATLTQSEIVKSNPVLERAIAALGLQKRPLDYEAHFAKPLKKWLIKRDMQKLNLEKFNKERREAMVYRLTLEDLRKNILIEPVRDTNLFQIKVQDFSSVGAAIIANAISRSYVIFDLEQQYVELQNKYTEKNPIVLQMKENIMKMEQGLSGQPLPNIEAIGPASVKIIEQASPPLSPIGLPRKAIFLLACVLSVFLGIFLAFMFEFMDQSFHSKNDLESFIGAPVIACINKKKGFGDRKLVKDVSEGNRSPRAISYKVLAQQLQFMRRTKGLKTLLFAPVHPKENTPTILANTAVFLSRRLGMRTLLVDAAMRHPRLHKQFDVKNEAGLAQLLEGSKKPEEVIQNVGENLYLLSAGRSHADPSILLDSQGFSGVLAALKGSYDVILIESSNLRDFRDTALIGPVVDGLLILVGESTVRRQVVHESLKHLREHNTKIIGAIMPNREYLIPKFLYESV